MRKIGMILLLLMWVVNASAQECKLKGFVRYKHNDYVGYRADAGAEVYIISAKSNRYLDDVKWDAYEAYAAQYVEYLKYKNDPDIAPAHLFMFTKWNAVDKENLDRLSVDCLDQYMKSMDLFEDIALIDESGKYEFQLPYGEYYVLFISKNRERPTVLEITNRKILRRVTLSQGARILSVDFEY